MIEDGGYLEGEVGGPAGPRLQGSLPLLLQHGHTLGHSCHKMSLELDLTIYLPWVYARLA